MTTIQTEANYLLTNSSDLFPLTVLFQLHMLDSEFKDVVLYRICVECDGEGRECMQNFGGET